MFSIEVYTLGRLSDPDKKENYIKSDTCLMLKLKPKSFRTVELLYLRPDVWLIQC